jgi:hypothetical protein
VVNVIIDIIELPRVLLLEEMLEEMLDIPKVLLLGMPNVQLMD